MKSLQQFTGSRPLEKRLRTRLMAVLLIDLGVVATAGGMVALHHTNTIEFCIPCHEMKDHNYAEYCHTIHVRNPRPGAPTATCRTRGPTSSHARSTRPTTYGNACAAASTHRRPSSPTDWDWRSVPGA
jgi:hypothetical protein